MLTSALMSLEGQDAADAKSFAGKVVEIVSTASSKSFATGKKTSTAMSSVVKAVLLVRLPHQADFKDTAPAPHPQTHSCCPIRD